MPPVVECVPNFSEGRRTEVIDAIADAASKAGGRVLDVHSDPDHNRSVITMVGDAGRMEEAAIAAAATAARLIDMDVHDGVHPCIGSTDVIPFVPVRDATMADCIDIAQRVGQRLAEELHLPVYLYGEAARRPERKRLPHIRSGGYDGLKDAISHDPDRAPDYGPKKMGAAGAVAVGARPYLVAFNALLNTGLVEHAENIARAVRESSGGLRDVQASGMFLASKGVAQVSMNLLAPERTPIHRVLELVRREAARFGLTVVSTELVGLVPRKAMTDSLAWYTQMERFGPDRVLETYLGPEPGEIAVTIPEAFIDEVAAASPTPGGGSVSAFAGSLGAALAAMVAGLTIGKPRYAAVEDEMQRVRGRAFDLQRAMLELMDADMEAFEAVMSAYRLPKDGASGGARQEAIQDSLRRATDVPLQTMRRAVEILEISAVAAEHGNTNAISDAGIAGRMAHAACHGASLNVAINIRSLRDLAEGDAFRREAMELTKKADRLVEEVDRLVRSRISG